MATVRTKYALTPDARLTTNAASTNVVLLAVQVCPEDVAVQVAAVDIACVKDEYGFEVPPAPEAIVTSVRFATLLSTAVMVTLAPAIKFRPARCVDATPPTSMLGGPSSASSQELMAQKSFAPMR
jgi:hypothetical protein